MGTKRKRSGVQYNPKGATQGNTLVCPHTGDPIDSIVDNEGVTRLAVDANVTVENASINVDLDFDDDGVHIGDRNSGNELAIESDGSINVNSEIDACDGDTIAISGHVDRVFDFDTDTINVTTFKQIYSYSPTNDDTNVLSIVSTVSTQSTFRLKLNGAVIEELRSTAGHPNVKFLMDEPLEVDMADTITVEAQVNRFFTFSAPYSASTSLKGYEK